jgi:putative copper resistance protein D
MGLNPIWDIAFALALGGKLLWYFSESPSRLGIGKARQFLFGLALVLALILLVGPVPHFAIRLFWIHMIQHVGLMMLISPLIVLGSPVKVALNSKYPKVRSLIGAVAKNRLIRELFRPQVGFLIFLATLILTHFSPLANAGMTNPNIHCLELVLFLAAGIIYYLPVLEGNPTPYFVPYSFRVGSLFAMMLPETMTGFFLYSGNKLLHDVPSTVTTMTGMSDQHRGGAIMWAMGMLIDAMWIVMAARDWFNNERELSEAMNNE